MCNFVTYDLDLLKEELSMEQVCLNLNIPIYKNGKYNFIPCPEHVQNLGREENKHDNCILNDNGHYHCFSCGAHGNVFNLIAATLGVDIGTAFNSAAHMTADPERYILKGVDSKPQVMLPLNKAELKLIGLLPKKKRVEIPVFSSEIKINKEKTSTLNKCGIYELKSRTSEYVYGHFQYYTLLDLYKEDKTAFYELIKGKIAETYHRYNNVLENEYVKFCDDPETSYFVKYQIIDIINEIKRLAKRLHFSIS